MIRRLPEVSTEQANTRMVELIPGNPHFLTSRCDPVEPVPVGTYVAMVFRVTGYDQDCDGSLMGRFEAVDRYGEATGWTPTHLGMYEDSKVVLDGPGDLHESITEDE